MLNDDKTYNTNRINSFVKDGEELLEDFDGCSYTRNINEYVEREMLVNPKLCELMCEQKSIEKKLSDAIEDILGQAKDLCNKYDVIDEKGGSHGDED